MNTIKIGKVIQFTPDKGYQKTDDKKLLKYDDFRYALNPSFSASKSSFKEGEKATKPREIFVHSPYVLASEVTLVEKLITKYGSTDQTLLPGLFILQNEYHNILEAFYIKMHKLLKNNDIDTANRNIDFELAFAEMRQNLFDVNSRRDAFFIHLLALNEKAHAEEVKALKTKYERLLKENESVIKDLTKDKADLKDQLEILTARLANLESQRDCSRPFNYMYPTAIIEIAILSIIYAKCSFRGAKKIIEIFLQYQNGLNCKKAPSHVSIRDWVDKTGYDVHQQNDKTAQFKEGYHLIIDQSVSVGSQQLLLILAVPDKRTWDHALSPQDVSIAYMKSAPHWNNNDVADAINQVSKKYGRNPTYCVSDGASNLSKALAKLEIPQHRDISHKFANYLKCVYSKCEDFKQWCKTCGDTRRFFLSELGYLMAPSIRSKARFMNIFIPALWSWRIIKNFKKLSDFERYSFEPIRKYASLIEELMEIQTGFNEMFKVVKTKGLCQETVNECKLLIGKWMYSGTQRQRELADMITVYFEREMRIINAERKDRLDNGETDVEVVHDISSDVIESMFGTMKRMMPDCKFFGITRNVLSLNLYTVIGKPSDIPSLGVEDRLKRSHFKELFKWDDEYLCESLLAKRKENLKTKKFDIEVIA